MTANTTPTALEELIRAWRELRLVEPRTRQAEEAEHLFDDINARGISDRELLLTASRLFGNVLMELVAERGETIDSALEALLRASLD